MPTYVLPFDASGRTHEDFTVPLGKTLYLVRAPQVDTGEVTVQDLLSLTNYRLTNGVTICDTGVAGGTRVSLVFIARSNPRVLSVNAEVTSPRPGIPSCSK